jgi:ATP-dependent HslUV protease ATP-binding subunit HslU
MDVPAFTPREIVSELDRYIVGQHKAKRAVAIALRNRWRRRNVADDLRDEIAPKNIIMIGPTGVGKTEIARRLAKLAQAPFLKVEASKFTEVGYVGRDVESMIRDLTDIGIRLVKEEETTRVEAAARKAAEDRVVDILLKEEAGAPADPSRKVFAVAPDGQTQTVKPQSERRKELQKQVTNGDLDERLIAVEVTERPGMPSLDVFAGAGLEDMMNNMKEALGQLRAAGAAGRGQEAREAHQGE